MHPDPTSIFALPDHRLAKADPALIAADEEHFAAISACLAERISSLSARLDARRRDPAGVGAQTIERDADIRRLVAELATLRRFGLDLCIGHYATATRDESGAGAERVYVGRIGLIDEAGDPLLVDWRTPAAEPFFAATLADPMGVTYRRRYRWAGGRIVDFWDELLENDDDEVGTRASLDDQSAFISSLGGARTGRMRDVLSTIQGDQNAIIRADSRGALVVDGGPGTGKTVVALHRAAYLLYADSRVAARRGNLLLVGPHRPYLDYVSDVLPALGEHSVQTATIADLAWDALKPSGKYQLAQPVEQGALCHEVRLDGQQQTERQEHQEEAAQPELQPAQRERSHRAEEQDPDDGDRRDEDAVQHVGPETAPTPRLTEDREVERRRQRPRGVEDLALGLERRQHHPQERDEVDERDRGHDRVEEHARRGGSRRASSPASRRDSALGRDVSTQRRHLLRVGTWRRTARDRRRRRS